MTQFQTFQYQEVHRSELSNAPYNPREMSDYAREKLRRSLETHGLVEPLVWNRRTGHLVGGHQRIAQLDVLNGTGDYKVGVAQIDVPLKQEMELNVALNNLHAQGIFNPDKLFEMLKIEDAPTLENMGLTTADLELEFGDLPELNPSTAQNIAAQDGVLEGMDDLAELRDLKRKNRQTNPDMDANYALMLVFPTNADKQAALRHWQRPMLKVMSADELLGYLQEKYRWRGVGEAKVAFASITEQVKLAHSVE